MPLQYREAQPSDAPAIIDFQIEMARETEKFELERVTCSEGVINVFRDAGHGRYYIAERVKRWWAFCS
jgi:hypothetical protein